MTNLNTRGRVKREASKKGISLFIGLLAFIMLGAGTFYWLQRPAASEDPTAITYETMKTSLRPMATSLNIIGLGDSLTAGVGDPNDLGYAGMTVQQLQQSDTTSGVHFKDYGVKGDTTLDLLNVLKKEKVEQSIKSADLIFMTIGGNDLVGVIKENFLHLSKKDFDKRRQVFEQNFNEILRIIHELNPKATIYYLGLYNPFEDLLPGLDAQFTAILSEWNQSSERILEKYPHTVFIPTADLFQNHTDEWLYDDHFHPNKEGYAQMSKRLLEYVTEGRPAPQYTKKGPGHN